MSPRVRCGHRTRTGRDHRSDQWSFVRQPRKLVVPLAEGASVQRAYLRSGAVTRHKRTSYPPNVKSGPAGLTDGRMREPAPLGALLARAGKITAAPQNACIAACRSVRNSSPSPSPSYEEASPPRLDQPLRPARRKFRYCPTRSRAAVAARPWSSEDRAHRRIARSRRRRFAGLN